MMVPESYRSLTEDLLSRMAEDWVSAAEVIDLVRRSGATDPETLRDLSMGLIARAVVQGLVMPGDIGTTSFVPWECTPAEAIHRVIVDWVARPDPFVMPGEIVWLAATQEGQRIGEAVWARESDDQQGGLAETQVRSPQSHS